MYQDGEALLLAKVRACNNFDSANTSRCNWKILGTGKSARGNYAILRPGPFELTWVTPNTYDAPWTTVIELWQRYTNDIDTKDRLYARIEDLLTGLMASKRLDDATGEVLDFTLRSGGEVEEMRNKRGGVEWLRWQLSCLWQERHTVTFA